ncbi:hypothetical protein RBB75_05290 [Tunturibacter empetritectus]|uniref:Uncharacterized protein n=1 Tax=Tunturiibacter empetritectus TaxID=3069691 RepID=A0AAU7ZH95_9BACT
MIKPDNLPPEMTIGAAQSGSEYAWQLDCFPSALAKAEALGYACLGGQFQLRLSTGTCEMYWLSADSKERKLNEPWPAFCRRSCSEILSAFTKLIAETDFRKIASEWPSVQDAMAQGLDPHQVLVFAAYFVNEVEYAQLNQKNEPLRQEKIS